MKKTFEGKFRNSSTVRTYVKFTKAYSTFVQDEGNKEILGIFVYSHVNFMLLVVVLVS